MPQQQCVCLILQPVRLSLTIMATVAAVWATKLQLGKISASALELILVANDSAQSLNLIYIKSPFLDKMHCHDELEQRQNHTRTTQDQCYNDWARRHLARHHETRESSLALCSQVLVRRRPH